MIQLIWWDRWYRLSYKDDVPHGRGTQLIHEIRKVHTDKKGKELLMWLLCQSIHSILKQYELSFLKTSSHFITYLWILIFVLSDHTDHELLISQAVPRNTTVDYSPKSMLRDNGSFRGPTRRSPKPERSISPSTDPVRMATVVTKWVYVPLELASHRPTNGDHGNDLTYQIQQFDAASVWVRSFHSTVMECSSDIERTKTIINGLSFEWQGPSVDSRRDKATTTTTIF